MQAERQGNRVTISVDLHGLPTGIAQVQSQTGGDRPAPHYIVWLVDSERRL